MIYLILFFIVTIMLFIFREFLYKLYASTKFEIMYSIMGVQALYEDFVMRKYNTVELVDLKERTAVITGGARGIGAEVVKLLSECGIQIVIGCRNVKNGINFNKKLLDENSNIKPIDVLELDLESLDSIKSFAKNVSAKYPKIHFLINNAGKMFGPYKETKDGFESQLGTNYLGHFYLTHLLMPNLVKGSKEFPCRIVNVSSCAHLRGDLSFTDINMKKFYIPTAAYSQSKLAQVTISNYLNRLFNELKLNIQSYSVHPGIVDTELFDDTPIKTFFPWLPKLLFKKSKDGAIPIVYTCISKELENSGGVYISNCKLSEMNAKSKDPKLQERFFKYTLHLLRIQEFGNGQ